MEVLPTSSPEPKSKSLDPSKLLVDAIRLSQSEPSKPGRFAPAPQVLKLHVMRCSDANCHKKWLELDLPPCTHCDQAPISEGIVTVQVDPAYRVRLPTPTPEAIPNPPAT